MVKLVYRVCGMNGNWEIGERDYRLLFLRIVVRGDMFIWELFWGRRNLCMFM